METQPGIPSSSSNSNRINSNPAAAIPPDRRLSLSRGMSNSPTMAMQRTNSSGNTPNNPPRPPSMYNSPVEQQYYDNSGGASPYYRSNNGRQQIPPPPPPPPEEEDDDEISQVTDPTMTVPPGHLLGPNGLPIMPMNAMNAMGMQMPMAMNMNPGMNMMAMNNNGMMPPGPPIPMNAINMNGMNGMPMQQIPMMQRVPSAGPGMNGMQRMPSSNTMQVPMPMNQAMMGPGTGGGTGGQTPRANLSYLPKFYNSNRPLHLHIYDRQEGRNLSGISADERALRIGLIVSEQEAAFGVNMYDSIKGTDEPEIKRLVAAGYNEDEAVLIIFEKKYGPPKSQQPQMPAPQPQQQMMGGQQGRVSIHQQYMFQYSPIVFFFFISCQCRCKASNRCKCSNNKCKDASHPCLDQILIMAGCNNSKCHSRCNEVPKIHQWILWSMQWNFLRRRWNELKSVLVW